MNVIPFVHEGLGNSSYLVDLGDDRALLVDPDRSVDRYLAAARDRGLAIDAVVETHLHADFVSGAHELGARGDARIFVPADARVPFPHVPASEHEPIRLAGVEIEALRTPGHTPEHLSYVVRTVGAPPMLFSGGSLIVGGAARTDLLDPALTDRSTREQYRSIRERLTSLPDETLLYPTHGAGSFCSTGAGSERTSSLGLERRTNPIFSVETEADFAEWFPSTFPAVPDYFFRLRRINHRGPRLRDQIAAPRPLSPGDFNAARTRATVVDARAMSRFMQGHIPGALANTFRDSFATWLGWLLPLETPLLFVTDGVPLGAVVDEALLVGFERFAGYLEGGMETWERAGLPIESSPLLDARKARDLLAEGAVAVDVREVDEYASGHLPGAIHAPLGELWERGEALPRDRPLLVYCGHGERATSGLSILAALGFAPLANLDGGIGAWQHARYAVSTG